MYSTGCTFIKSRIPCINQLESWDCAHYVLVIQDSIQVGCVPPACQPYVFWWPPLGVGPGGGRYPRSQVPGGGTHPQSHVCKYPLISVVTSSGSGSLKYHLKLKIQQ